MNKSFLHYYLSLLAIWIALSGALAETPKLAPFSDGTRYVAAGDSITHIGRYLFYTDLFYLTRFPKANIVVMNAGIAGDNAAGGLRRLSWDMLSSQPTIVSLLFGMNDVKRELYNSGKPSPDVEVKRAEAIDQYEENLRALAAALLDAKVQVTIYTPTIFDDTASISAPNCPGVNRALGECAKRCEKVAHELNLPVVDLYTPMNALNQRVQTQNPTATIVGPDRIHPQPPGHFVMAYFILKAQQVPADIARVSIALSGGKVAETVNCKIDEIKESPDGVEFRYEANALPYPMDEGVKTALDWVPFLQEMNREMLQVSGLKPGIYNLSIDGKTIRSYTMEELAGGVNLALEAGTPQALQAGEVMRLLTKRWEAIRTLRDMASVECRGDLPHPRTLEQMKPLVEARLAANPDAYMRGVLERYLANKPNEALFVKQGQELLAQCQQAAQPKPHQISVMIKR